MKKIILLLILVLVISSAFFYSFNRLRNSAVEKPLKTKQMKQLTLTSPAFGDRERIPSIYTCDGEDVNPPLVFGNVPEDARSLALIVEDPDAPGKTWVHWVLFNIPPETTHIGEDSVPAGAIEAMTDFGKTGYGGACPPSGTHRYYFKLYALDTMLDLTEDVTLEEIKHAMNNHIIAEAELVGLYSRD